MLFGQPRQHKPRPGGIRAGQDSLAQCVLDAVNNRRLPDLRPARLAVDVRQLRMLVRGHDM
jgi:hypothetical protein